MPRMTVYVPDDLKTRMDECGEGINWSAVAQRAFSEAVAIRAIKRNPADMNQVIERLRASKARVDKRSLETGRDCGRVWARETAEYDELKRVADWTKVQGVVVPFTLELLKHSIDPREEMDRFAWHDFWGRHGKDDINDAFAEGFIKGSAEIFSDIEGKL